MNNFYKLLNKQAKPWIWTTFTNYSINKPSTKYEQPEDENYVWESDKFHAPT